MRIPGVITIAVVSAAAACAGEPVRPAAHRVAVCSEIGNGFAIARAQSIAGQMFGAIGVRIDWHRPSSCPPDAIRIAYRYQTDPLFMPQSLAYALPYEGIHIVMFYDRIQKQGRPGQSSTVLAHVIVHEITHVLQGVCRHSESGIMKATWTTDDYRQMVRGPLTFTDEDVHLIQKGLEARESRTATLQ